MQIWNVPPTKHDVSIDVPSLVRCVCGVSLEQFVHENRSLFSQFPIALWTLSAMLKKNAAFHLYALSMGRMRRFWGYLHRFSCIKARQSLCRSGPSCKIAKNVRKPATFCVFVVYRCCRLYLNSALVSHTVLFVFLSRSSQCSNPAE